MKKVMVGFLFILGWNTLAGEVTIGRDPHPAASAVKNTLQRGLRIVELKSDSEKKTQLCQLIKSKFSNVTIGNAFLGKYRNLSRDQAGIDKFKAMIPSILATRLMDGLDQGAGGRVEVDPGVKTVSGNLLEVSTRLYNSRDQAYRVAILVKSSGYRIVDGVYMGFSAVNYLAREYQKALDREYNKNPNSSKPVSVLVRQIRSENGYVNCG